MIGWLIGWLREGGMVGCEFDGWLSWLIGLLADRLVWLIGWLIGLLVDSFVG